MVEKSMKSSELASGEKAPKLRADAQRNREKLMESAKAAFAETGPEASLDEIARRAGVGIGTLYRHFPNREALVAAVYQREVKQLADEAYRLLETHSPGDALHEWMRLSVGYVASKRMIASALGAAGGDTSALSASSANLVGDAVSHLVERAIACGDIRPDVSFGDIRHALTGFALSSTGPNWAANTLRFIDIFMDGLRTHPAPDQ